MALDVNKLARIRSGCSNSFVTVNYTKSELNLAAQAFYDYITNNVAAIRTAMVTASGKNFTLAQCAKIAAYTMYERFLEDK